MQKIEISKIDNRILGAMADEQNTTPEELLAKILADIRVNRAGIRHDDTPEEEEARVAKLERRAAKAKAGRLAANAPAVA